MVQIVDKPVKYGPDLTDEEVLQVAHLEKLNSTWDDQTIDPELDRRITRKFDVRIVPWLFGLWLLAFIDRSNIGNARIAGLATDLKLEANKFNIALAVFYVPCELHRSLVSCHQNGPLTDPSRHLRRCPK